MVIFCTLLMRRKTRKEAVNWPTFKSTHFCHKEDGIVRWINFFDRVSHFDDDAASFPGNGITACKHVFCFLSFFRSPSVSLVNISSLFSGYLDIIIVPKEHCYQIWQNFVTLAKFKKFWAILWGLSSYLATFYATTHIFVAVNDQRFENNRAIWSHC